jgi:hypothetical protein
MALSHVTLQRLSFVKYLYQSACEQSRSTELLAAASLLMFHDAIEMFLQISAEHLDAGANQPSFMDYWHILSPRLEGRLLPQKESMRRLNKARVALKHNGTFPSRLDTEAFRASSTNFFSEACPIIFGISFEELSLIEYVSNGEVREHLKKAQSLSVVGDTSAATDEVAVAYEKLIDNYSKEKISEYRQNPFSFGPTINLLSSGQVRIRDPEIIGMKKYADSVQATLRRMQETIRILALGIDFKKYMRFKSNLPNVVQTTDGKFHVNRIVYSSEWSPPDKQYVDFCILFVVECAVRLNESDSVAASG